MDNPCYRKGKTNCIAGGKMTNAKKLNKILSDAREIVVGLESVKAKGVLKLHLALAVHIAHYKTQELIKQLEELKNEAESN